MGVFMRIIGTVLAFFSLIGSIFNPIDIYEEIECEFSDTSKASYSEQTKDY